MPTYNPYTDTTALNKYQFLHHFLPHPETKKRARLLSHIALIFYSVLILVVIGFFQLAPKVAPGVLGYASSINIDDLLLGTNNVRAQNGLSTLIINPDLTKAAEKKAAHMFTNDYWAHIAPDGTAPWDFILGENYDYTYAGENLAKNFNSSSEVVEAWSRSPSHRDNLLSGNYTEIGLAVVDGVLDGYETTLVVQMFGNPRVPVQVATVFEEPELAPAPAPAPVVIDESVPIQVVVETPTATEVLPAIDVTTATRSITLVIGGFLVVLLVLDIWYTRKKAIPKLTGNAFAHVIILILSVAGVWFALSPGKIL